MKNVLLALATAATVASAAGQSAGNRIVLPSNGKKVFVTGMNLAWINYAQDVVSFDSATMATAMKAVHDSGGNTMRIWLSTNGVNDPKFDANGYVSGPNAGTVASIQKMLKIARNNDMVLILTLMSHNWMSTNQGNSVANNRKMLQTDSGISAYVDKYVVPVVTAIGADPNILCWEVFNEPEGMVMAWSGLQAGITMPDVQKVVNRVAGAIHRAVPGVLVSNGAVTMDYTSNVGGTNYYTDSALKAVGGDADGHLDFYMAHYYSSNGAACSPFTKTYAYWKLDKPLVIAEYASEIFANESGNFGGAKSVDSLLKYLDDNGYAGGLGWMYYNNAGMAGFSAYSHSMGILYRYDSLSVKLTGLADNKFTVAVTVGNGGTVKKSVAGRIAAGTRDTLIAVHDAGYTFKGWTGDTATTNDTLILVVSKDVNLMAGFAPGEGTNLLKGGDLTTADGDSTNWSFYAAEGSTAKASYAGDRVAVTITKADTTENWKIQFSQGGFSIEKGASYVLSFDGWSTAPRTIALGLTTSNWRWQSGGSATLGTTSEPFSVDLTSDTTANNGVVQFNLSASAGPVFLDNISLVKKGGATSIAPRRASPGVWTLSRVGSTIAWSRSEAFGNPGTARVVGIDGREFSHASFTAGARSGELSVPATGIAFLVLESGGSREVKALPLAR